jgi:uncharacterized RDD family membrane protein YckC
VSDPRATARYLHRRDRGRGREVVTPEGVALDLTLAGAGDRAAAFLLDFIIISAVILVLALLVSLGGGGEIDAESGPATAFVLLAAFLLRNFYFMFFEMRWRGTTPGKRIIGIRVIDRDGGPLSSEGIIARNLVRDIEVFVPLPVIFAPEQLWPGAPGWARLLASLWAFAFMLLPLLNKDRLRVGDIVGGTLVVLAPKALLMPDLAGMEVVRAQHNEAQYTFTPEHLETYGEYELQVLEGLLRSEHDSLERYQSLDAVCERIKTKIKWPHAQWNVDSERFLREFYAALRARLERNLLLGKRRKDKFSASE